MATETWYLLEDGTPVPPSDVTPRQDGRLVHSGGALVAQRRDDCPMSSSVDPTQYRQRELTPETPAPGYKTREYAPRRGGRAR